LHRFGLFDAALFKDNHLATMRSLGTDLEAACRAARAMGPIRFVEVEVDTLDQLDTVLSFESGVVDIILLDNMPPEMMAEAVRRRDDRRPTVELEASGGISEATIQAVAQSGVDRISVGALTHSVQNLDLGFDL
jgi:nicotinate-nucleotide pyrophosphorylase (carboxylating)